MLNIEERPVIAGTQTTNGPSTTVETPDTKGFQQQQHLAIAESMNTKSSKGTINATFRMPLQQQHS
jgi:hypothetical protein